MSKRTRGKEEQDHDIIFRRSKKVIRSPEQQKKEEETKSKSGNDKITEEDTSDTEKMDELKEMVQTMMLKMDENMKEIKREIKMIKGEMEKKEESWKREKEILIERIDKLESNAEREERLKKKNNIILKGLKPSQNTEEKIKKWIEEKLHVQVDFTKVIILNKGGKNEIIRAELPNWEQKQMIMSAKKNLKNTQIYIDNDLTWEERKIQREIRNIARVERAKGKSVKIGYQKIIIGEEVYYWDKQENGVSVKGNADQKSSKPGQAPKND